MFVNRIAEHIINTHGTLTVFYMRGWGDSKSRPDSISEPMLLHNLCWEDPTSANYPEIIKNKISELTELFIIPISNFIKSRSYLAISAGFLDRNSFFSKLPNDVTTLIGNLLTADLDSSGKALIKK